MLLRNVSLFLTNVKLGTRMVLAPNVTRDMTLPMESASSLNQTTLSLLTSDVLPGIGITRFA